MSTCLPLTLLALTLALTASVPTLSLAQSPARPRLLYDRAHGQNEPAPPVTALVDRAGLDLQMSMAPITAAALDAVRVLYLRAPSTPIAPDERAAIVAFVRGGGSLLLVMDENKRQDIA